jgi:hypothetical protein
MTSLEEKLIQIATRESGQAPNLKTSEAIRESVHSHHLWLADQWLLPLLDMILASQLTGQPVEIPSGYPNGSSGLSNLLLDLQDEPWMQLDDHGEAAIWKLPVAGVEVFLDRESGVDTYLIRKVSD